MTPHYFLALDDGGFLPEHLIKLWIERGHPNPYRAGRELKRQEHKHLPSVSTLMFETLMLYVASVLTLLALSLGDVDDTLVIVAVWAGYFVVRWIMTGVAEFIWRKFSTRLIPGFEPFLSHYEKLAQWSGISYQELADLTIDELRDVARLILLKQEAAVIEARVRGKKPHKIERARSELRHRRKTLTTLGIAPNPKEKRTATEYTNVNFCRRCGDELPK